MRVRWFNVLLVLAMFLPGAGTVRAAMPATGTSAELANAPVATAVPPGSLPPWDSRAANPVYGGAADEAFVGAHPALADLAQFQAAYAASPGSTGALSISIPRYYGANSNGVLATAVVDHAIHQAYLVLCSWDLDPGEAVLVQLPGGATLSPQGSAGDFYCDAVPLDAAALYALRFPTAPGSASSPTDSQNGPAGSPTPAINSLTITYPAGEHALIYEARLVIRAVRPVVLVPGFGGEASTYAWGEIEDDLNDDYGVLTERPCDYEWVYKGFWPFGSWQPAPHHRRCFERVMRYVDDTGTLATNSLALRYEVEEVRTRYGVIDVNLVGHSKGGMFSRAYVSAGFYQEDVENLVSISSPQLGGYIQDVAVGTKDFPHCDAGIIDPLCELGRGILEFAVNLISDLVVNFKPNDGDQAGLEVTEWYYETVLHALHRPAAGVSYHTVAATSGLPEPNQDELDVDNHGTMAGWADPLGVFSTIYTLNYYSDQTPNRGQSDIFMSAVSQRFANMDAAYQAQETTCGAIRANHEQSSVITHAANAVAGALGVQDSGTGGILACAGITDLPAQTLAQPLRAGAPTGDAVSTLQFVGPVAAGKTVSTTFVVDGDGLSVAGLWQGAGSLTLTLRSPSGELFTPLSPQPDAGVEYTSLQVTEDAGLAQYTFSRAAKGTWTAYFMSSSAERSMPAAWKLLVAQTGGVKVALAQLDDVYPLGTPIELRATAFSGAKALSGGHAEITLDGPETSAQLRTLSLADSAAADGVYGATFTPSEPGIYRLSATFTGETPEGLAYQRQDIAVVAVAPDGAKLTGAYDDAGVDADGDGLLDALYVNVGLRLTRSGEYTLIGDLRAADGAPLGSTRAVVTGDAGDELDAVLAFDPALWAEHGGAGVLVLSKLSLFAQDQLVPVTTLDDVYATSRYAAADFAGWTARRSGAEVAALGVDENGDGAFEALDVTWPLEVRRAGVYTVTARLMLRPDLPQLEAQARFDPAGEGDLAATLRFSGREIALSTADGPYTLTNLTVSGPHGLVLVDPLPGMTPSFTRAQFAVSAQQAAPQWRVMPIRSEEEFDLGMIGGEAEQHPHSITRSPSDPNVIYFSHDIAGVWRSYDGGAMWRKALDEGLTVHTGHSVQVDPVDPYTLFLIADNSYNYLAEDDEGLFRSFDGGDHWERVLDAEPGYSSANRHYRHNIAYDPSSTTVDGALRWYVAFPGTGELYRSEDGGTTWGDAPVDTIPMDATVYGIYAHPSDGQTLYVASDRGLYASTARGAGLAALGDLPAGAVTAVAIRPDTPQTLYATVRGLGLYRSTNGGTNFTLVRSFDAAFVFMNPGFPDTLYLVGVNANTIATHDGGATWIEDMTTEPAPGLGRGGSWKGSIAGTLSGIVPNPEDADEAVAFSRATVWKTTDGGQTFVDSSTLFTGFAWSWWNGGAAFDRLNPDRFAFFNCDVGMTLTENGSDYFVQRNGQAWSWYQQGLIGWIGTYAGDFQSQAGSQVMVAAVGNYFVSQLMRTADAGQTWELVTSGDASEDNHLFVAFHPDDPNLVYAGDKISLDAGQTFNPVDFGAYDSLNPSILGMCLADPDTIYAMDTPGREYLLRSDDRGVTWYEYAHPGWDFRPLDSLPTFAADPADCDKVYTLDAAGDLAIYDGATFTSTGVLALAGGSETNNFVRSVTVDPTHPEVVYAGMFSYGIPPIWRSTDGGVTWSDISYNLPRTGIGAMAVNPHTGELFKGSGVGTWVYPPPYESEDLIYDNLIPPEIADGLVLQARTGDRQVRLDWQASGAVLPAGATWRIAYEGPAGDEDSPVTGIISPTRSYTLTGLAPSTAYTFTLNAMQAASPVLTATASAQVPARPAALELHGTPGDATIALDWSVAETPPPSLTWRIDYEGPAGDQASPITGIVSTTRSITLTGLTNGTQYSITLSGIVTSTFVPLYADSITATPYDTIRVYLPLVLRN